MQPPTAEPRGSMTDAQVVALIETAPALTVGRGAELLDMRLNWLEDISEWFLGGYVERNSYAKVHGSGEFAISRRLDWGRAIVRPYMAMTDGVTSARFNLGAYFTNVPDREVEEDPPTWGVGAVDILHGLASPIGGAYAVEFGTSYLQAVETVLADQGFTTYSIDPTALGKTLPTSRTWVLDEQTTWLTVVNDLLAAIGYAGIWSDWDGRLRCHPYESPATRAPEWLYHTTIPEQVMLSRKRIIHRDYFDAPNRWVFYRSNNVDDAQPVEGNGLYTYVNERNGPTSVEARGRTISKPVPLDVADHASLVAQAQSIVDADTNIKSTFIVGTSPNPLHWHFDRLYVDDPKANLLGDALGTSWRLPLDGGDMSHEWTLL